MANGFPGGPGPPPMIPPFGGGLSGPISMLASRERRTALDKVRKAVELLEEAREEDPRIGSVASMAIHVLKNGEKGLEDFQREPKQRSLGAKGIAGVRT